MIVLLNTMKKFLFFTLLLLVFAATAFAQYNRYIIQFKDKGNNPYSIADPLQYLSQRSIDRRLMYGIPIDSTDLPIAPAYIDSIRLSGNVTLLNSSKWLNMLCIQTTDAAALSKINAFPFVVSNNGLAARPYKRSVAKAKRFSLPTDLLQDIPLGVQGVNNYYNYGQAYTQIHLNNGDFLHNHGFRGEQMVMGIFDVGFYKYKTLPTFDSIRNNNQIKGTWDFVANDTSVNEDVSHGVECLSTIGANMPGQFVGTAPKASFYLYITEDNNSETVIEELNWASGAERADSVGVNLISTSLGYNEFPNGPFDHTYADMNGDITIAARATDFAAQKGILVLCAIGNSGEQAWHYLTTPADADSCLAVGAVTASGQVAGFSSYGPSSDLQIKPDVAALGFNATIVNANNGLPSFGNGTSFATPILAGITTCLWQAFPEVNNMTIIDALRKSSNKYLTPDNRSGYGIPDAKRAFVDLIKQLHTANFKLDKCNMNIEWSAKCASDMNFVVERKGPSDIAYIPFAVRNNAGDFSTKDFVFQDDLSALDTSSIVHYRIQMNIAADTSFYLDSFVVNYTEPCTTYIFNGDGNWDIVNNWGNHSVPPDTLVAGSKIIIDPVVNGECILNKIQYIAPGAILIISDDKKLLVPENLIIQTD